MRSHPSIVDSWPRFLHLYMLFLDRHDICEVDLRLAEAVLFLELPQQTFSQVVRIQVMRKQFCMLLLLYAAIQLIFVYRSLSF